MPINLYHPLWKEFLKYLGWILLFVFLWFRGCSGTTPATQTAKVIVPEVKAKFEAKKPVHEAISSIKERTATGKEILQVGSTKACLLLPCCTVCIHIHFLYF